MSDTPEPQDPNQPEDVDASPIEPSSEAPDGLPPSPGLQPPAGIQPPQVESPQYQQPPQTGAPQYQPPQFGAPQYQPPQTGAPQYQPPQTGAPQYQPPQPVPPKKGLPTGAIIGIIAGGVVLILLIVAGVIAIGALTSRGSSGGSGASNASPGAISSAPEAVEEYLTALSEGDAERAGAFVDATSGNTLLTDEVLAKSNELAPITNIVVDEETTGDDDMEMVVSATFDVGDETVSRTFLVWHYSDEWQIFDGLVNISLSAFDGLDATVNGVEVDSDSTQAFIGTYQIGLGIEQFTLSGDTDTFTLMTDESVEALYELQPTLTTEATEEFRTLVTASLTECVAMTSLATPCGLDVTGPLSDGAMPVDGTIQRTLTADGQATLKKLKPESSYDNPTVVSTYDYIQINTTVEADLNGERVTGDLMLGGDLLKPTVDFSEATPKVTWE